MLDVKIDAAVIRITYGIVKRRPNLLEEGLIELGE